MNKKKILSAALAVIIASGASNGIISRIVMAQETAVQGFENNTATVRISQLARYSSGMTDVDGGVMEIVDYNKTNGMAYAINGKAGVLTAIPMDILKSGEFQTLDGMDINVKALVNDESFTYGDMTSVAVSPDGKRLAASIQAEEYEENGRAVLFTCGADGSLTFEKAIETGVQPDMITFTPDGRTILTANEGEPREGYADGTTDPDGTVSVINVSDGTAVNAGFEKFDHDTLAAKGVILKKDTAPSKDLEPEYITADNEKAYVTLQEANSVAVLDIAKKEFENVYPLGTVDFSKIKIDLDKGNGAYMADTYANVRGLRMPDAVASYKSGGKTYILTANEGDSREWGTGDNLYSNEDSKKLMSDSGVETGKKVTFLKSDDYDGLEEGTVNLFGARSFTVFEVTADGLNPVYDSGSDFEEKTAAYLPDYFNCSNDSIDADDRSNKKGPEAETVTVGEVGGRIYAFVTLERIGGVMVYDITKPTEIKFANYINSRDFSAEAANTSKDFVPGADNSPEGLKFVPALYSPTGNALLLAACEVGGTVAVYELTSDSVVDYANDGKISVYFTNDVHCGYLDYDRAATIFRDKDLLVDAGDNIQGDLIGTLSKGEYPVDIMNFVGYDAAVPGNHEFDYGMEQFFKIARSENKLAKYDYLSCNFRSIADNKPLLDAYKIYSAEGKKIALVGITTPETLVKSSPAYFKDENGEWIYDFSNDIDGTLLYKAVQTAVDSARAEGADYVIAVGHLGTDSESSPWTSAEVIANTTDIDAFIDGHSHSTFNTVLKNKNGENVTAVQTGTKLENIGKLTIDAADGDISSELIPVDGVYRDAATNSFLKGITENFAAMKEKKVAESEVDLLINDPESGSRIIRNRETNLGDLCADAYREKLGTDIAFVNGGGIRANIDKGDITFGEIVAVHPYGNEACSIEVTGQQILDALEWASRSNPGENGGFLQVSGLEYEIYNYIETPCVADETGAFAEIKENAERRVKNVTVGGVPIEKNKTYTLGGHNYMLFELGDGFNMFEGSKRLTEGVAIDNQVLIDYIVDTLGGAVTKDSKYANPYGEGRIEVYSRNPDALSVDITGLEYDKVNTLVKAVFDVKAESERSVKVITAVYDKSDALEKILITDKTFNNTGADTAEFNTEGLENGAYSFTVMVWSGFTEMMPKAIPFSQNIILE